MRRRSNTVLTHYHFLLFVSRYSTRVVVFRGQGFSVGVAAAASAPVHRGTRKLRCLRLAGVRP